MWGVLFQWFETICHPCTLHTALGEQLLPNFNQMITLKKVIHSKCRHIETFPSSLQSPSLLLLLIVVSPQWETKERLR